MLPVVVGAGWLPVVADDAGVTTVVVGRFGLVGLVTGTAVSTPADAGAGWLPVVAADAGVTTVVVGRFGLVGLVNDAAVSTPADAGVGWLSAVADDGVGGAERRSASSPAC